MLRCFVPSPAHPLTRSLTRPPRPITDDYLPWARCGVAVANTPWSGSYEITSPTWSLAHTSQFAPIGWRYTAHGSGVEMLSAGGSIVTRVSPDHVDFSIVLEKMTHKDSVRLTRA